MTWPAHSIAETLAILTAPGAAFEMEEVEVSRRRLRSYVHLPATLRALFDASRDFGSQELLVFEDDRLTFDAHWRGATAFGRALAGRFGIRKGDRVAIAMRNYPEWSVCAWGALAVGAVIVPLNAWDSGETLAALLDDCGATIAIVDSERLNRLRDAGVGDITLVVARAVASENAVALTDLIGDLGDYGTLPGVPLPDPGLAADDLATIFYTSGTTGRAKGATGTHRNILTNYINTGFRAARALVRRGEEYPGPAAPPRRILLPLPLFHVTGFHSTLVPALASGAAVHLMYKWDVGQALRLIAEERINTLTLVPALAWDLSDALVAGDHDVSSVDAVGYGGASAAAELAERVRRVFPQALPGQGYGATETSSLVAANSHEDMLARPGSVGICVPCCDIRIVGDDGSDVPPGEPGEIWICGPNVVQGYWNLPDATRKSFRRGWYRTGDVGRIDAEGFIFILDRMKDMLIRGGENIYCTEIEDCLAAHPDVLEAAVFGIPERVLGEVVGATVLLRTGALAGPAFLQDHVRARLAAHKVPVAIDFHNGPLPRNAAGKLLKNEIKTAFLGRRPGE
jgi:long-chain acyl-CoA synthetase